MAPESAGLSRSPWTSRLVTSETRGPDGAREEGFEAACQGKEERREKNSRGRERLPGPRDTELLYSEQAACVGGSSHQANLLFILLLWVAGP